MKVGVKVRARARVRSVWGGTWGQDGARRGCVDAQGVGVGAWGHGGVVGGRMVGAGDALAP